MITTIKYSAIFVFILGFGCSNLQSQSIKTLQKTLSADIPEKEIPVVIPQNQNITVSNGAFNDATGRTLFVRGINLGGSTKVPYDPNIGSHVHENFYNGKEVSFTGRPFPLEEADIHFRRLKAWGFHFLRFLITWEAIEHEGPGIYDGEYLEYLRAIISKAAQYDINVLIDPHQDAWSRFTGGDGAPLWTFEAAGMDATKFQETGAAFIHNIYGDPYPKMIWYTNYYKLASATMFTLFFGGNDFAPHISVAGKPIQEYLQEHYINALVQVALMVEDLPNIIGFELMNEPSAGYIGIENIDEEYHTDILGDAPTPYQGMLLGDGIPQCIKHYRLGAVALKESGNPVLNTDSVSVWKNGFEIWRHHGVWDKDRNGKPVLLKKDYFSVVNGQRIDFNSMYYEPFIKKYTEAILAIRPDWIICVDNILFPYPCNLPVLKKYDDIRWINGSHWYDDVTLVKKKYLPFLGLKDGDVVFGKKNVMEAFKATLDGMMKETQEQYGNVPSLLGEFGVPFDMYNGKSFKTGNFRKQVKALDRSFRVAETNLLNYALWNYTADNTHQRGDQWNGEDLSIYSSSQQNLYPGINAGGRALEAVIRPYPKKINGKLLKYKYDYKSKTLTVRFETGNSTRVPTEIFLPEFVYGYNFAVYTDGGQLGFDRAERMLMYSTDKIGIHTIVVSTK